jgi:predicted HicB family RNase H-like nuclease
MSKGVLNIRGVPPEMIRKAKAAAAMQGVTLRDWVLKAIADRLKK